MKVNPHFHFSVLQRIGWDTGAGALRPATFSEGSNRDRPLNGRAAEGVDHVSAELRIEERVVDRPFFWNEEPVLHCSLHLPRLTGGGRGIRRIDRYYQHLAQYLVRTWERRLYPIACEDAVQARAASYPFQPYEVEITYQVTCLQDGLLSLYWDCRQRFGKARDTFRQGDTWVLDTGSPLPMSSFFPRGTKLRNLLPRAAAEQAASNAAAGTSVYFDSCPALLRRYFDRRRFYLTPDDLAFFYPSATVAPWEEGIAVFTVPLPAAARQAAQ